MSKERADYNNQFNHYLENVLKSVNDVRSELQLENFNLAELKAFFIKQGIPENYVDSSGRLMAMDEDTYRFVCQAGLNEVYSALYSNGNEFE